MYLHTPLGHRLTLGVYLRAWSEAVCDRPSCAERAVESGVELRYRVQPGLDLGVGLGVQRSPGTRTAPSVLPRIHLSSDCRAHVVVEWRSGPRRRRRRLNGHLTLG